VIDAIRLATSQTVRYFTDAGENSGSEEVAYMRVFFKELEESTTLYF